MTHFVPVARQRTYHHSGRIARFSWDNNSIFKSADLQRMGLQPADKVALSEYSPDLHKPIEHVFAQLKHAVQEQLLQPRSQPLTAAEAQQLVYDCFMAISTESIRKDVDSLPVTYHVVAGDKGVVSQGPDGRYHMCSGGDWPARQYR
jgi:hypothetical protein